MPLYHKAKFEWYLGLTSSLAQLLASRTDEHIEAVDITEHVSHSLTLADGATDQAVNMGGLSNGLALLIVSSKKITAKIDGQSILIGKDNADGGELIIPRTNFTTLTLTNASGEASEVYVSIPGA